MSFSEVMANLALDGKSPKLYILTGKVERDSEAV
jgi:hypothetical protein